MSHTTIRVVGGLLPPDVLSAVLAGSLDGLSSDAYHLGGEAPQAAAARVWTHLLGVYRRFRDDLRRLPDGDPAVGATRERWIMVLLGELGYGRVPTTPTGGITVGDQGAERAYPVSHLWGATPIHLLGWGVDLDTRTAGVAGAAQRAPHAMVQELLNRTDTHLWAILSNGRLLRLLRDSTTMTGQSHVEFDLEAMFDGEVFADFVTLYLLCHQSRVEVPDDAGPADCWLERWRTTAVSQGVRALSLLRDGVHRALETLGTGVLQHPANTTLRDDLASGVVRLTDLHQSLLRTVYRLLFWAVAEDRDALLAPHADPVARARYNDHFSSRRLRQLAARRHGSPHDDVWQAVTIVLDALGRADGEPRLGLPGLGGLFTPTAADVLTAVRLGNVALLQAVRSLSIVQPKGQPRRHVDFRHLGAEELGSIYESLLELVPRHDPTTHELTLEVLAGNERKTTGSYYTPTALVDLVLDTALDPVLDAAEKAEDPESALLALKVCDPAIGSGHFMVAAARRIATRLATVRTGELDPTPTTITDAMHDVVARCIYGVDLNPMAADLAKVGLWLEAMSPGRPLSFLDHHIKVGNALLGATPRLLHEGIPDAAFTALTGDDKAVVRGLKKRNALERAGQGSIFDEGGIDVSNTTLRSATDEITQQAADALTLAEVSWAAQRYDAATHTDEAIRARRTADAWCAAFLTPKTADAVPLTHEMLGQIRSGTAPADVVEVVDALATRHRLFHWHLEFPEVFAVPHHEPANTPTGWTGGFDATLGNPPWESLQMSEKEFFAARAPAIAEQGTAAARKKAIEALAESNPALHQDFLAASHAGEAESHLIRSGRFPLCARGKLNTYSIFAEHFRTTLTPTGRSGIITPTGLATDATTAAFFADTLASGRLAAFYDFENEAKIFEGVHNQFRFAVSSMSGGDPLHEVALAFYTRHVVDVSSRRFLLAADEVLRLNPNTGTLPVFRSRRDAEITLACYRAHPVLIRDDDDSNPWGLRFSQGLFNMASDSSVFLTASDLADQGALFDGWGWRKGGGYWLPLYEAKMLSHHNHRYSTYAGASQAQLNKGTLPRLGDAELDDPSLEARARYWVDSRAVEEAVPRGWRQGWFLGWRDIGRASDVRTFVPSALPRTAVGHVFPLAITDQYVELYLLQAVWSSLACDYIARQKLSGTHMTYGILSQLACPAPEAFDEVPPWSTARLDVEFRDRMLELVYNSHRLRPYAADIVGGYPGPPFRWLPDRRAQLTAELDAAIFHLYGLDREDTEHVLDSFFVVRKYEERDHGEFRTMRLVLAAYDAMAAAAETGVPFQSPLDPSPGHGPRHPDPEMERRR